MSTQIIEARVKNLIQTETEWLAANPVILKGEVAYVQFGNQVNTKVGDGIKTFSQLTYNLQVPSAFMGNAQKNTNPGIPLIPSFYFPSETGVYPNFGGLSIDIAEGLNIISWNQTWSKIVVPLNLSTYLNKSEVEKQDSYSINKQNPANIIDGKIVKNDGLGTYEDFAAKVYFAAVLASKSYTIGGYTFPAADKPLILRFEDILGNKTGFITLSSTGKTTFVTPANTVKIIYTIERHDVPAQIQPYNQIMLLEGDRVADYPAFVAYGLLENVEPRITKIQGFPTESKYINEGLVTTPSSKPNSVVTKKELADKNYTTEAAIAAKGYGIPDIIPSLNKQDPANKILDQWINQTAGNYVVLIGAIMYYKDVAPSEIYTLSGYKTPVTGTQNLCIRFNKADGSMISYVLLPDSNAPYTFTIPALCSRIVYSVMRPNVQTDYSKIMLELGNVAHSYDAYPGLVSGFNKMAFQQPAVVPVSVDTLTFQNADKIVFPGCSYVEGGGIAVKDKNWINKFSEYTNFQVVNYGVGGNTFAMITARIIANNASFFSARGTGFNQLGARFATVQNIGNETKNYQGVDSDAFRQDIKANVEAILSSGYFPVFSTDYFTKNPFIAEVFRRIANEQGSYFHDQGAIGEKLLTVGVPAARWWGTHPDTRGNSHSAAEEIYQWNKLWKPLKSIKVFRKRSAFQAATVQDLNFEDFTQRARKLKEITVGNRALAETSEEAGWGYMDRANLAPNYTKATTYIDEYLELLSGNPIVFNQYAVFQLTIDKVRNTSAIISIKMAQSAGAKFWLKTGLNATKFVNVTASALYSTDRYTISLNELDLKKYVQYDSLILIIELAGDFSISDFSMTYSGGFPKQQQKVWFEEKKTFTEKIAKNTFDANWITTGGWTNAGATLNEMSAAHKDYPSLIAPAVNHVSLTFDAADVPASIKRTITFSSKPGFRKAAVRVVSRLFPKLYRPDLGETTETTAIRLITPDSYDQGQLCLSVKGNTIPNVMRETLFIGWTERYFEFEIPPFQTSFEMALYRDPADIIDKVNYTNHTYPLDICYVSCQIEGE